MSEEFFTDESVEELALNHIEEIIALEESEAKRVMKAYRRVRQDLRDRLDALSGEGKAGTFSAQKARAALVQVDMALKEMSDELNSEMDESSEKAATFGYEHLIKELKTWNKKFTGAAMPINLNVAKEAAKTSNFLFNQRESSLQSYNGFMRGQIARAISDAVIAQDGMSEIVSSLADINTKIGRFFLGEEWRLHRIVRTELHNVYNVGKISGMKKLADGDIPDLQKTLFHPMDIRTGKDSVRLNANNPVVDIDKPFIEYSTGKKLEYMAPPNRPNDRAILIPYREEWKS